MEKNISKILDLRIDLKYHFTEWKTKHVMNVKNMIITVELTIKNNNLIFFSYFQVMLLHLLVYQPNKENYFS